MKKLIFIALTTVLIFAGNGCKLMKHKELNKTKETVKIENDVSVSQQVSENLKAIDNYKFDKSTYKVNETISYKPPVKDDSIELTASFNIDTAKSLKGDTALTLVGPGIKLTITRNPHNNSLTANIKSGGKSKNVAVGELLINRSITANNDLIDTSKIIDLHREAQKDSIDKTIKETEKKTKELLKNKESKPNPLIWLGIAIIIIAGLYFFFRRK